MLRSLFSGITGLRAHQTLMDVVANNISNVNTTGFKTSTVTFEDTLSQAVKNAAAPGSGLGGMNPAQVGLGVQLGGITTNFRQGSAQNTGKPTDLMIQGDGFFVLKNGSQPAYSRAGAFNFDTSGTLSNAEGMIVQGWMGKGGIVNTDGVPQDIKVAAGQMSTPKATGISTDGGTTWTGGVYATGNIVAGTTDPVTLGATVYDTTGAAHSLSIVLTPTTPTPDGKYTVVITDNADPLTDLNTSGGGIAFAAGGASVTAPTSIQVAVGTDNPPMQVQIDFSGLTQFGGSKSVAVTKVDGYPAGSLQQFQINPDGTILGIFSNQQKQVLGTIALANFNNPSGLSKIGSTAFSDTSNSGLAQIGTPNTGGRGLLLSSALEMSNVDLAQEFTNMIIAQRGFQANSRVITTSDQMLQDLVDLKR